MHELITGRKGFTVHNTLLHTYICLKEKPQLMFESDGTTYKLNGILAVKTAKVFTQHGYNSCIVFREIYCHIFIIRFVYYCFNNVNPTVCPTLNRALA
jgi:hypothetical protein